MGLSAEEFSKKVLDRIRSAPPARRKLREEWIMAAAALLLGMTLWAIFTSGLAKPGIPAPDPQDEDIPALIQKLGSDLPQERERARKKLEGLGERAEPQLREATRLPDKEIAATAGDLLRRIQEVREETAWRGRITSLPRTFGAREFKILRKGQEVARGSLKTTEVEGRILLEDSEDWLNGKARVTAKQRCARDWALTPESLACLGKDGNQEGEYEIINRNGVLTQKTTKGKAKFARKRGGMFPVEGQAVMTTYGAFRVVGALPQRKGFVFPCAYLETEDMGDLDEGHKLICLGEEDLELEGKTTKAWKWRQVHHPFGSEQEWGSYWVVDGLIVKALFSDREWIFSSSR
jgi:hypothetical protein